MDGGLSHTITTIAPDSGFSFVVTRTYLKGKSPSLQLTFGGTAVRNTDYTGFSSGGHYTLAATKTVLFNRGVSFSGVDLWVNSGAVAGRTITACIATTSRGWTVAGSPCATVTITSS